MIGNTFQDYIKIQAGITSLRLVTPLSLLYLIAGSFFFQDIENFNRFVYTVLSRKGPSLTRYIAQPPAYLPPNLTREQRRRIVRQCLTTGFYTASPHSPYPSCWFLPPNHGSKARRRDVRDWLAWALFSVDGQFTSQDVSDELEEYISLLEEASGITFLDDPASKLRSIRVSLDPVLALHRPLLWYLIVAFVDTYTSTRLFLLGFRHYTPSEPGYTASFPPRPVLYLLLSRKAPQGVKMPFWYRPHTSLTKHPLIFLHGIGIGLFPYISFFTSITQGEDRDVGVIIPELLPISMHITPKTVPPRPDILHALKRIVEFIQSDSSTHVGTETYPSSAVDDETSQSLLESAIRENKAGWNSIVLAGHSYGTFIAGWIIREYVDRIILSESTTESPTPVPATKPAPSTQPQPMYDPMLDSFASRISHFVLIDPIPILLSHPAVAYNFLYRDPHTVCPKCHNTICNAIECTPYANAASNRTHRPSLPSHAQTYHRPPSLNTQATITSTQSGSQSIPSYINTPRPLPVTPKCNGAWYSAPSAWQLWYFASRDPDVARTLFRSFFWSEGGLWRDDLAILLRNTRNGGGQEAARDRPYYGSVASSAPYPSSSSLAPNPIRHRQCGKHRKVAVVLAGLDQIVPAESVRHHLTQSEEWVERWIGRVDREGAIREVEDYSVDDEEREVRIMIDRPLELDDEATIRDDANGSGREGPSEGLETGGDEGILEVLFNPCLDHASIFDSDVDLIPLVDVVKRDAVGAAEVAVGTADDNNTVGKAEPDTAAGANHTTNKVASTELANVPEVNTDAAPEARDALAERAREDVAAAAAGEPEPEAGALGFDVLLFESLEGDFDGFGANEFFEFLHFLLGGIGHVDLGDLLEAGGFLLVVC
ncbi:hypothetical protein CVT24_004216 [Panaeolus cyanescens]|uniref:AB hydrolase-1 domain-containing protein n=1 Tax=Panaeolus cyanescens TaxID=181874 RepID=A0A409YSW3_9AGAR|nr:hypothetical protein CVT24_004216 [Panaeolus cyanescens]